MKTDELSWYVCKKQISFANYLPDIITLHDIRISWFNIKDMVCTYLTQFLFLREFSNHLSTRADGKFEKRDQCYRTQFKLLFSWKRTDHRNISSRNIQKKFALESIIVEMILIYLKLEKKCGYVRMPLRLCPSIFRKSEKTELEEKQHFNWSRIPLSSRTINYKFDIFLWAVSDSISLLQVSINNKKADSFALITSQLLFSRNTHIQKSEKTRPEIHMTPSLEFIKTFLISVLATISRFVSC